MSQASGESQRVALVIGQLTHGGAERQLVELAIRLPARGFAPVVFCLSEADQPFGARLEGEGITVRRLERRRRFEPRRVRLLARALKEEQGEAEERRLFYVAVTRARDELCLCVPEVRRTRDGGVLYCEPSRFVREIPEDLLREVRVGFI